MNFISVKNNKKTINLKNKNKNYEVNAQWLYEHSKNSEIRDNYTNQLLIEAAEIDENLYIIHAEKFDSEPIKHPNGVRTALTMTTLFCICLFFKVNKI